MHPSGGIFKIKQPPHTYACRIMLYFWMVLCQLFAVDFNVFLLSETNLYKLFEIPGISYSSHVRNAVLIMHHAYKEIHIFSFINSLFLGYSSPAQSTPVYVMADCSFILKSESGPEVVKLQLWLSFKPTTENTFL